MLWGILSKCLNNLYNKGLYHSDKFIADIGARKYQYVLMPADYEPIFAKEGKVEIAEDNVRFYQRPVFVQALSQNYQIAETVGPYLFFKAR